MNAAVSIDARDIALVMVSAILVSVVGCSPSHPVVTDTTEPWQEELARERQTASAVDSTSPQKAVAEQMYDTDQEDGETKEQKHSPFVVAITDIIGFPFRGAGWLARQLF